ncbi:MAG: MBL fold metallo-hydrolase [Kiritimatiellae bacterium]|nr:MBL fold metallo-hydrolase [Kiritimatiellia bacterium]MCO5068069.1 MBL fold metallo-hydrolase [Kiritimatiellia bacterium]
MKLIIGGVRGTSTVAQASFLRYGGETTSLLIEGRDGARIILDAGTGIQPLGDRLAADPADRRVLLLMTHYHLDHVVGLPSLGLIYDPAWHIRIAAPAHDEFDVGATMSRLMDKPFWPLQVSDLLARVQFDSLTCCPSPSVLRWGGFEVRCCPLHHPGGCTAYRIDEPATGASLVVATDVEWGESSPEERAALRSLCTTPRPVSLLLMDAQYEPEEYEAHRGWGHSTWKEALELADAVGAARVRMIHHDPRKNDDALDRVNAKVSALNPAAALARAGEDFDLG